MVTRHYLHLQTQFGEDRCTQFWSYRGNRPTNTQTNKQTQRHDRLQYTAPLSLARSVKIPCKLIRFSSACASVTYIQSVRPIWLQTDSWARHTGDIWTRNYWYVSKIVCKKIGGSIIWHVRGSPLRCANYPPNSQRFSESLLKNDLLFSCGFSFDTSAVSSWIAIPNTASFDWLLHFISSCCMTDYRLHLKRFMDCLKNTLSLLH